jgi:FkbM family methyltransferase
MMDRKRLVTAAYRSASRYPFVVTGALRVRNIANGLAAYSMVFGQDPARNGEERLIRRALPNARVVFDVGANVGDWAALALSVLPPEGRLVCFEPSLIAAERLAARFGREPRVELVQLALSDTAGERLFYEEPDAGEASSLLRENTRGQVTARPVTVSTVDVEYERAGVDHIDMLKIDAEGFDLHVLRGAERCLREATIDVIQFEYNRPWIVAGATLGAAVHLLEQLEYTVFVVTPDGLRPLEYDRFGETFGYANLAAVAPRRLEALAAQPQTRTHGGRSGRRRHPSSHA